MAKENQDKGAIYVRTSKPLKDLIERIATERKESISWVAERVFEAFDSMSEWAQTDVLDGRFSLDRVADLVSLLALSGHAFSLAHWSWSIELYELLAYESKSRI